MIQILKRFPKTPQELLPRVRTGNFVEKFVGGKFWDNENNGLTCRGPQRFI